MRTIPPMFSIFLVALFAAGNLFGQVEILTEKAFRVDGLENVRKVGSIVIADSQPAITTKPVGIVRVNTDAANIEVNASDLQRNPVDLVKLDTGVWCLESSGKVWIEVVAIDFAKNIYSRKVATLELGPPAPPPPPPPPPPGSCDSKTNPDFDGLAKRACVWANQTVSGTAAEKRGELAKIYLDIASKLELGQIRTINDASNALVKQRADLLGDQAANWNEWNNRVSADFVKYWSNETTNSDKRSLTARYYRALGEGLK